MLEHDPVRSADGVVEALIRNQQNQLISLSTQADTKASILLTACSLALSVTVTHFDDDDLRIGLALFVPCVLLALVFAALTVLPNLRFRKRADDPHRNPLFFLNVASLDIAEYRTTMRACLEDPEALLDTILDDFHSQAVHLCTTKFRFLRAGYLWFLIAIGAGGVGLLIGAS